MIDVIAEFNELYMMLSCGIIAGIFMFSSFFILSSIIRLFIVISHS